MNDISSNSQKKPVNGSMHETPERLLKLQAADLERVPALGLGFTKTTLDPKLHERLLQHFRASVHKFSSEAANGFLETENPRANPSLFYQDDPFNLRLMADLKDAHEEWSGQKLEEAACYGIRVYQRGGYLYNHIDQVRTHAVSSTICVDHRLDSPWPLYIEDLEGTPHEVLIEPGEMVFYEGARLTHGRPYALDGDYYANIYVHYTPIGWKLDGSSPDQTGS